MKTLLLLSSLFIISHAFADSRPIQLEGKKLGNIPIRVLGSAKYKNGNFGSKDKSTVNPRHLNGLGADAMAGVILGPFFIGGGGEYMSWLQSSDPKDNSDASGSSVNFFGSAGIALGRFLFLGKYYFQSTYQVNKEDINGDKIKYSSPEGSYSIGVVYRFGKRSFLNAEYSSINFSKEEAGGTTTSLAHGEKITFSSVGLSYGVMF